jgi:hypothetical protein
MTNIRGIRESVMAFGKFISRVNKMPGAGEGNIVEERARQRAP